MRGNTASMSSAAKGEIRCVKCDKLIAKALPNGHLEIKCPRCGALNLAFDEMAEQVIVTDPDGKILYINKAAERATGYDGGEVVGKRPSDLWGKQMPIKFYGEMWKTIKGEKNKFRASVVNKNKKGELYEVDLIISPIFDTDGAIIFYVCVELARKKIS